jgi:proteasome lid subunit RPN8/RPN11
MDLDIQFGEVEETPPEVRLRPDRNKHYAVAAVQSPSEDDLPIFVDLDVMRDMEEHAQSDTTVELGGVLLGGQHHDEEGRPFVIVTDSLRAQHFEATKGSFKFTHDTWSQISRERDEFPEDLQMVGWYHTHPDWGVFLSGMDMFICDNFFNKPLDVALVIDPCRGDRGMFQWTGDSRKRIRRTEGFYLIASRFRQLELELHAALYEGNSAMPQEHRYSSFPAMPAPVVNIAGDRQPPWQMIAVMGMLTMQFLLVGLLAWKLIDPLNKSEATEEEKRVAELEEKLEKLSARDEEAAKVEAQMRVLDRVVVGLRGQPSDLMDSLEELQLNRDQLADQVESQRQAERQWKDDLAATNAKLKASERREASLKQDIKDQVDRVAKLEGQLAKVKARLKKYEPEPKEDEDLPWWRQQWVLWSAAALLLIGLAVMGVFFSVSSQRRLLEEEEREEAARALSARQEAEKDDDRANNP